MHTHTHTNDDHAPPPPRPLPPRIPTHTEAAPLVLVTPLRVTLKVHRFLPEYNRLNGTQRNLFTNSPLGRRPGSESGPCRVQPQPPRRRQGGFLECKLGHNTTTGYEGDGIIGEVAARPTAVNGSLPTHRFRGLEV